MARLISKRLTLTGKLEALDAIHIGGAQADPVRDMPLARDGAGRLYIPGTSLAGVLRAACRAHLDWTEESALLALWSETPTEKDERAASLIRVFDAVIESDQREEIREGVGIDRKTGAAAAGIKYDRSVIPAGARFDLRITIDISAKAPATSGDAPPALSEADALRALALIRDWLASGSARVGAAKTRGLGRVKLCDATATEERLDSRDAILERLAGAPRATDIGERLDSIDPDLPQMMRVVVTWLPVTPVMSRSAASGAAVDMLPQTGRRGNRRAPLIQGAGVKGALRSEAERILRTLSGEKTEATDLSERLFGAAANPKAMERKPGKGALAVSDVWLDRPLSEADWFDELTAAAGETDRMAAYAKALQEADYWTDFTPATLVAIDRWHGGAAEGALYARLEPPCAPWSPIVIEIDLARLEDETQQARALALLFLVLRELVTGAIPLGFGATRGLGAIQVTETRFEGGPWHDVSLTPADFENADALDFLKEQQDAWAAFAQKELADA